MFKINKEDKTIHVTRGDVAFFAVRVNHEETGEAYVFASGDIICFKVFGKKDCENVVLERRFDAIAGRDKCEIVLTKEDTSIGDVISKPVDYWYEVTLNPDTEPQTVIGYDDDGPKIFRLFPEGAEA